MFLRIRVKDILFPGIDFLLRKRIRLVKKYLICGPVKTLDAGCGNGAFSLLCQSIGNTVLGIDIDSGNIKRALEYRDYKGIPDAKVKFMVYSIYNLLALNQGFDQILCFEALEHLLQDRRAIEIFAKLLNAGGVLHLGVPNLNCPFHSGAAISQIEDGAHVRKGYNRAALKKMLQDHGFKIVKSDNYGGIFTRSVYSLYLGLQNLSIFKGLPKTLNEAKNVLLYLCLNPFTYMDGLFKAKPMSIYIMAKKT